MSDNFFYNKFSSAVLDILEQYQQEQFPNSVLNSPSWSCKQWLKFFIPLYVKYIDILKRIEDSYDQTTHPQLRKTIKKFLENIMCRVIQIKRELIFYYNPPIDPTLNIPGIPYIFLDDYLIDLKLEPDDLNLPIPRYFQEDTEATINRNILIEQRLIEKNGQTLPEQDITKFFFKVDLNVEEAVKIIQNFEMGRQNLKRISKALKLAHKKVDNDMGGENKILMEDERKRLIYEHLIAVQKLKKAKEEEMKFLKMLPSEGNPNEQLEIKIAEENRKNRKIVQKERATDYENYKKDLEENIKLVEGYNIHQDMMNQRKDWLDKEKIETGTVPLNIDLFYKRLDVEKKVELDEQQKKVAETIAKDKLKKEQDKKKKDENGALIKLPLYAGPTKEVMEITNFTEEFKNNFENPSEFLSKKEGFIHDLARNEVIGCIEESIRKQVDAIMDMEIKNKRLIINRGKKDPAPRRQDKNKPPSEKMGPGEKAIVKTPITELLSDAVSNGVLRKMISKNLEDLVCDFNYIAHSMDLVDEQLIDVPLFYTKQLIKEYCIYPLGSQIVKSNCTIHTPSILFFGPPGTGKTHAALAIAHHTNSLFIDFSPRNMERFTTKEELTRAVATAFRVAKNNQPAVIYFDCAEQIFVDTKKYKKGAVKNPSAQRMKKMLISFKNLITPDMRIMFIGCTNKGWHLNKKDMGNMFDKTLYFSLPSFSDRFKIWKNEISKKVGRYYELEYDILAQMSNGYSAESIIACIDYTLTKHRLDKVKFSSIVTEEFISALSKTQYQYKEDFAENRTFLYEASGLQAIHSILKKRRDEYEKNNKKR